MGRPDDGSDVGGFNMVETYVERIPQEEWKTAKTREELSAMMNDQLRRNIPGADFLFSQYIEDNVNEAISGLKGELGVKIYGPEAESLQSLSDHISRILKEIPGSGRRRSRDVVRPAADPGQRQSACGCTLWTRHSRRRRVGGNRVRRNCRHPDSRR